MPVMQTLHQSRVAWAVLLATVIAASSLAPAPVRAEGLLGSEVSLRSLTQQRTGDEILITAFPVRRTVRDAIVEYPNVASLFGPEGLPSGAHYIDTTLDVGANFVTIDFDHAGSGSFARWIQNTYVFEFNAKAELILSSPTVNHAVTTVEIDDSMIRAENNRLFINVSGLKYNRGSFLRVEFVVKTSSAIVF